VLAAAVARLGCMESGSGRGRRLHRSANGRRRRRSRRRLGSAAHHPYRVMLPTEPHDTLDQAPRERRIWPRLAALGGVPAIDTPMVGWQQAQSQSAAGTDVCSDDTGVVPGGGPVARLPRLIGRGRALEVLLVADDIDATLAERYGYVNRVVPDDQLEQETDRIVRRLASFDKQAIAETKAFVDATSLPDDEELPPALSAFFASAGRPATQARLAALASHGLGSDSELEQRLGELVTLATARPDPSPTPRAGGVPG
jgi:hypothetical protein